MKVSLNFSIKDLEGKEIPDSNAGKVIANLLANANEGNAVKYVAWALTFHAGGEVELDKADFDTLKSLISDSKNITNLVKAQALEALGEFK